jgi:hypothetical protein
MNYKEFLRNWGEEEKATMTIACGACGLPIKDEYVIHAIPELGRVCQKCYRGINFQAQFFTRLVEKG